MIPIFDRRMFATCPGCGYSQPQHPDGRFFVHSDPAGPRGTRCAGEEVGAS